MHATLSTDPTLPTRSTDRSTTPRTLPDLLTSVGSVSSVANIVMQLSLPAVGEGVSESRVISGSPRRRPVKRGRTTMTYLALAAMGTEADRAVLRREVAQVHRHVRSGPASPVAYDANAPDQQLWVAVCLFRYFLDQYRLLHGELPRDALDELTKAAAPLATGLNVRSQRWPASWDELEAYWHSMLPRLSVSPQVRADFEALAKFGVLREAWGRPGGLLALLLGPVYFFLTRGNLPPFFRALLGWEWSPADQRRFERVLRWQALADRLGNRVLIRLFYRVHVWDFRLRVRCGRPVLGRLQVADRPLRDGGGRRPHG